VFIYRDCNLGSNSNGDARRGRNKNSTCILYSIKGKIMSENMKRVSQTSVHS
jgi:hypothetical protein